MINGEDYFKLPKEALVIDPNHIPTFKCDSLKLNDDEAIRGEVSWIIETFADKINDVDKGEKLKSIEIEEMNCNA